MVSVNVGNLQWGRDVPGNGKLFMAHSVSRDTAHEIRALEGGLMLKALVPDDVLTGLFRRLCRRAPRDHAQGG